MPIIRETGFQSPPKKNGISGTQSGVMSLVNFKHKITTSANYTDGIGRGYTSHDKELCLHGKRLKN